MPPRVREPTFLLWPAFVSQWHLLHSSRQVWVGAAQGFPIRFNHPGRACRTPPSGFIMISTCRSCSRRRWSSALLASSAKTFLAQLPFAICVALVSVQPCWGARRTSCFQQPFPPCRPMVDVLRHSLSLSLPLRQRKEANADIARSQFALTRSAAETKLPMVVTPLLGSDLVRRHAR